nr:DUF547 domain-containing protein [Halovenus rubra]
MRAIRYDDPTGRLEERLAAYDSDDLAARLDSNGARIAFWCNLYNGATQQLLETDRDMYESRGKFFSLPALTIAGETLSLDDIEHGILRRSYSKLALGYIRSPFRDAFAEKHEISERDPRVHFALNCGAESCPPIVAYSRDDIETQLDLATQSYLDQTVKYNPASEQVLVPVIMRWFRGDFRVTGGRTLFLRRFDQIPSDAMPDIVYDDWSWSLTPNNFAEDDDLETAATD